MTLTGAGVVYAVTPAPSAQRLCLDPDRAHPPAALRRPRPSSATCGGAGRSSASRSWMWSVILVWVFFGCSSSAPTSRSAPGHRRPARRRRVRLDHGGPWPRYGPRRAGRDPLPPGRPSAAGGVVLIGFAAIPLSVALEPPLAVLVAGHILGGVSWAFWSVMWSTSVQTQVPLEVLNRVTAYEVAGSVSGVAVGQALVGPAASWSRPGPAAAVHGGHRRGVRGGAAHPPGPPPAPAPGSHRPPAPGRDEVIERFAAFRCLVSAGAEPPVVTRSGWGRRRRRGGSRARRRTSRPPWSARCRTRRSITASTWWSSSSLISQPCVIGSSWPGSSSVLETSGSPSSASSAWVTTCSGIRTPTVRFFGCSSRRGTSVVAGRMNV